MPEANAPSISYRSAAARIPADLNLTSREQSHGEHARHRCSSIVALAIEPPQGGEGRICTRVQWLGSALYHVVMLVWQSAIQSKTKSDQSKAPKQNQAWTDPLFLEDGHCTDVVIKSPAMFSASPAPG